MVKMSYRLFLAGRMTASVGCSYYSMESVVSFRFLTRNIAYACHYIFSDLVFYLIFVVVFQVLFLLIPNAMLACFIY